METVEWIGIIACILFGVPVLLALWDSLGEYGFEKDYGKFKEEVDRLNEGC